MKLFSFQVMPEGVVLCALGVRGAILIPHEDFLTFKQQFKEALFEWSELTGKPLDQEEVK